MHTNTHTQGRLPNMSPQHLILSAFRVRQHCRLTHAGVIADVFGWRQEDRVQPQCAPACAVALARFGLRVLALAC